MSLESLAVHLPFSKWANQNWREQIANSEGLEKRIWQTSELVVPFAASVEAAPPSIEKIAWCLLWSRAFGFIRAARALDGTPAASTADLLFRPAFDNWVHIELIRQPFEAHKTLRAMPKVSVGPKAEARAWEEVADRLRAYLAWLIASDILYEEQRSRPWELKELYQPIAPEKRPPDQEALHRFLFGESEVISADEAALDRRRAEQHHRQNVERLREWLATPAFAPWAARLEEHLKHVSRDNPFPTFSALIDEKWKTMASTLTGLRMPETYVTYARDSMLLHGSSLALETHYGADGDREILLFKRLMPTTPPDANPCAELVEFARLSLIGLTGMSPYVIPGVPRTSL